jgi:hypothetical protein
VVIPVVSRRLRAGDVAGRHDAERRRVPVHELEFERPGKASEECGSASGDVGVDDELVFVDEAELGSAVGSITPPVARPSPGSSF